MTVSAQQNWTVTFTAAVTSVAKAYGSVPTAGNLLVCVGAQESDTTTALTIADDMTDGGTWTALSTNPSDNAGMGGGGCRVYAWWKVVGATANSNKTVTVSSGGGAINIFNNIAEYTSSGSRDRWEVSGTPVKASADATTNPTPGALTTSGAGAFVIIGAGGGTTGITAVAGYVKQVTTVDNFEIAVEDKFTTAGASETASWTASASDWDVIGFAFRAYDPIPSQRSSPQSIQRQVLLTDAEDEGQFNELDVRNWWKRASAWAYRGGVMVPA